MIHGKASAIAGWIDLYYYAEHVGSYITGFWSRQKLTCTNLGSLLGMLGNWMHTKWSRFSLFLHDRNCKWSCKFLLLTFAMILMHLMVSYIHEGHFLISITCQLVIKHVPTLHLAIASFHNFHFLTYPSSLRVLGAFNRQWWSRKRQQCLQAYYDYDSDVRKITGPFAWLGFFLD